MHNHAALLAWLRDHEIQVDAVVSRARDAANANPAEGARVVTARYASGGFVLNRMHQSLQDHLQLRYRAGLDIKESVTVSTLEALRQVRIIAVVLPDAPVIYGDAMRRLLPMPWLHEPVLASGLVKMWANAAVRVPWAAYGWCGLLARVLEAVICAALLDRQRRLRHGIPNPVLGCLSRSQQELVREIRDLIKNRERLLHDATSATV
jgi:hypothetical protein